MKKHIIMKSRNFLGTLLQLFVAVLVLVQLGSCETDDPAPSDEDTTLPVIQISGITDGDTLSVAYEETGTMFNVEVSDAVGIASFSLEIAGTDISITKDVTGTQITETVDVSTLDMDTEYAVAASAQDAAGNIATLNFTLLITTEAQAPYDSLFMIGSATPAGWSIGSQVAMTRSGAAFTWEGTLIAGELKFPAFSGGDWCGGDWILAEMANQPVEQASGYTIHQAGCAPDEVDFKWVVATAGDYKVTIDFAEETVSFQLLGELTGYDRLYLVGDATPGAWDIANAAEMTQDENDELIFEWEGVLTAGEFKIATQKSFDDGVDWIHPLAQGQDLGETGFEILAAGSGSDNKWVVAEEQAGNYKITVNLALEIIKIEFVAEYYQALYLVGDATPSGWDVGNATEMTVDETNPARFSWEGTLISGEFKISTAKNFDDGNDWIHPLTQGQSLTATDFEVVVSGGGSDHKWVITEETTYRITVDLENGTIDIGAPYANVYLVGDATTSGWDPYGANTKFTRDADDIYLFTYTGPLSAGEFKIHLVSGDWCEGDWINATTAEQVITDSSYIVTTACDGPDNKWKLTEADAGTYVITADLRNQTLTFEKQ